MIGTDAKAVSDGLTSEGGLLMVLRDRLAGWLAWRSAGLGLLIGAFGALGQAPFTLNGEPFHIWPATAVMIVGFVWLLDGVWATGATTAAWRSGFWRGYWLGAGYFLAGLWWVGSAFVTRGPAFAPFAPIGVAALGFGLALFWGAAGAISTRFWTDDHRRIAVFAIVLCLVEYVRGFILSGFPWNLLGHVWPAGGAMSQTAAHIGVWGLMAFTIYAFAAPAALWSRRGGMVANATPSVIGFVLLSVCFAAGLGRLSTAEVSTVPDVRLRLVQVNMTLQEKYQSGGAFRALNRYLGLAREEGLSGRTHVIWPENAVPLYLAEDSRALDRIQQVLDDDQILITGAIRRDPNDQTGRRLYNSLFVFSFNRGVPWVERFYDKTRLVPFGEFVPMSNTLSRLGISGPLSRVGGYSPGSGALSLEIPKAPDAAPMICYEAIFPGFAPRGEERPGWIVNISNDSWYGNTAGPWQFLNQTRYRAIEEGLPVVRSVSGGVSGVVDPFGRMPTDQRAPFGQDYVLDVELPAALPPTLYSIIGDASFVLIILAGVALSRWRLGLTGGY